MDVLPKWCGKVQLSSVRSFGLFQLLVPGCRNPSSGLPAGELAINLATALDIWLDISLLMWACVQ